MTTKNLFVFKIIRVMTFLFVQGRRKCFKIRRETIFLLDTVVLFQVLAFFKDK